MRVATPTSRLDVEPGTTTSVVVEVRNTGDVIDGVSARVIGLPEDAVVAEPALLPLFPDASGQVNLALAVPQTLGAGRHPLTVEVISHGARLPSQYLDIDMDVAPRPALAVTAQPRVIRARRTARYTLDVGNRGNTALDVELIASDADRAVSAELSPSVLRLEPGASGAVFLAVRGPRMFTGTEIDRAVTVSTRASAVPLTMDAPEPDGSTLERETTVRLRQRPLIGRGMLTALILTSIVALWALVFLLGLTKVFAGDPMTKQAPASFFLADDAAAAAAADLSGQPGVGNVLGTAGADSDAPAGALPKSGQMPVGSGGALTGTVRASTDNKPVGRITVEALRIDKDGHEVTVSAAATQSDGTFALGGLFPTEYYLKFSAPGYRTVWFPSSPTRDGASTVTAEADGTVPQNDVVITGNAASISGTVNPGDTLDTVVTEVTARPLLANGSTGAEIAPVRTTPAENGDGTLTYTYALKNLPAPATYQITFKTAGYLTSTIVDRVGGGDKRLEPVVTLGATTGQYAGHVVDATGKPLGGVTVSTTVNGAPLEVATPTTGDVGAFALTNLVTPGTYVVTFSSPGNGSVPKTINLEAGQQLTGQQVVLSYGTGSIVGTVKDSGGKPLGGVTVTAGGSTSSGGTSAAAGPAGSGSPGSSGPAGPSTTTLTSDGSYSLTGLSAPGTYTLTFSLAGYTSTTLRVTLDTGGAPFKADVAMGKQLGTITGTVVAASTSGNPKTCGSAVATSTGLSPATVTATNGQSTWTVATTTGTGAFTIANLPRGSYSLSANATHRQQCTAVVEVAAGDTVSGIKIPLLAGA